MFWAAHEPTYEPYSRQYRSAVFYHDPEQHRLAQETMAREAARLGAVLYTALEPYTGFTLAEDYHQKYKLRNETVLLRELQAMLPSEADLVGSTAAARINGLLAGYGTRAQLEAEIDSYGLSPTARQRLLGRVRDR